MFSGIIEEIGTVKKITTAKNLSVIEIQARKVLKGAKRGESVAINGACLTIRGIRGKVLIFDVISETLQKTTLGSLEKGSRVNLEKALKRNGRFDGHFVTGHIDCLGKISKKNKRGEYIEIEIAVPGDFMGFLAEKGSVAIDGISLTVNSLTGKGFSAMLIPHTIAITTLYGSPSILSLACSGEKNRQSAAAMS